MRAPDVPFTHWETGILTAAFDQRPKDQLQIVGPATSAFPLGESGAPISLAPSKGEKSREYRETHATSCGSAPLALGHSPLGSSSALLQMSPKTGSKPAIAEHGVEPAEFSAMFRVLV